MAEKVKENLFLAFSLINNYSDEKYDRIQAIEDVVDKYEDKIGAYLIKITSNELNFDQTEDIGEYQLRDQKRRNGRRGG
jgi:phosphate:Na+ symporter